MLFICFSVTINEQWNAFCSLDESERKKVIELQLIGTQKTASGAFPCALNEMCFFSTKPWKFSVTARFHQRVSRFNQP